MTRILTIVIFFTIAFLLIRYSTNEKVQKGVVIAVIIAIAVYTMVVMTSELIR
jgi:hypothetical protein